jgi:hypothetical protein
MNKKSLFVALLLVATIFSASAQNFKKGSITFLKSQTVVNLVFDFEGVTIDGDSEESLVKERMADRKTNDEAEDWKTKWYGEWRENFKSAFTKYCNDELKSSMVVGTYPEAEYTIKVKIVDIDPGNFAGPFSNPAKLRAKFNIVKTNENNSLASIELKDIYNPVRIDPIEINRITAGFGQLGKELAEKINKAK